MPEHILDIIIPQYTDGDKVVKQLLDSIAFQKFVDLDRIGVIIVNDGTDVRLSNKLLESYPFEIDYYLEEHRGVGLTRQAGYDKSRAEYVMYCDTDDYFFSGIGLYQIFNAIELEHSDIIITSFYEEVKSDAGAIRFKTHDPQDIFVHGKAFKREFIEREHIRWAPELPFHEDVYYVNLCILVANSICGIKNPFYMWTNNPNSASRQPQFMGRVSEYGNICHKLLTDALLERGYDEGAKELYNFYLPNDYRIYHTDEWWTGMEDVRLEREKELGKLYLDYEYLEDLKEKDVERCYSLTTVEDVQKWIEQCKLRYLESNPSYLKFE